MHLGPASMQEPVKFDMKNSHIERMWRIGDIAVDTADTLSENSRLLFGGVPEWPKGSDCKSDGSAFGGSNPPPSTKLYGEHEDYRLEGAVLVLVFCCGCSSTVEPQPSKLMVWVRFPSPAPFIRGLGVGR